MRRDLADICATRKVHCIRRLRERFLKKPERRIAAIILAAGGSARFGTPKQLLTFHGENLVRRAARTAIEAGLDPVIVVLGAYASTIESFLSGLGEITVVVNDNWRTGQASSIHIGVTESASSLADAALILLADQPFVDASSLERLIDEFDDDHRVIASRYGGILGAPAIFGAEFFDNLLELTGDHGAGAWLRGNSEKVTAVKLDEAAVDIDTPSDLKHLPND